MAAPALRTWLAGVPPAGGATAGTQAVVIDVLRATSTLVAALAEGASYILAAAAIDEAFAARARLEAEGQAVLLGGEREGVKVPGFDLGNSPAEYTPSRVGGRAVVLCTTNGTAALSRCAGAAVLYAASFLNAGATAQRLLTQARDVTLCCAGKEGAPALEDLCCAGLIATRLLAAHPYDADDATALATLCWREYKTDPVRMLGECNHGRYLAGLGFDADLAFCARVDAVPLAVSRAADGKLTAAPEPRRT